jgi:hypothetical protein
MNRKIVRKAKIIKSGFNSRTDTSAAPCGP